MKVKKGFTKIKIDKLVKADWNYKEENEKLSEKLLSNMKRNGQIENILIRELETGFFEVVNGNHRLDVMNKLKIKDVQAYNFGKIGLPQAQRIALETNETKFENDSIKMAELVTELTKEFDIKDLVDSLPYTIDEINNMNDLVSFDFNEFETDESESGYLKESFGDEKFSHNINLNVTAETFERWKELKEKFTDVIGYENESKVFEFAIIEALNIPMESLN
ncbi:MAG: hypothetical protein Unbinned2716contig1000_23 [Prokaryotic dsDNA virus sp.]|nr:MAG: hypothetical protein Unbinned2716contig1000_23 [Prokaryotic dsDNA virus sp.]|tara:strand:+ start:17595 stop:18257 length:663 start_codon:yes stop_codon:yes gene_type:complete